MKIGSLFSGIGGFELGLKRGFGESSRVVWQVEIDPYCRSVLARHWPDADHFDDVRSVGKHNLAHVDVLCGGFPCQDISVAGLGAGITGARSGLWFEFLRIIEEIRPAYVIAENVAALKNRGLDVVLRGLRDAGYRASWSIVGAAQLGAPHRRNRMWIVAHRADVAPAYAPAVDGEFAEFCDKTIWPANGGDPELWERGIPRTTSREFNLGHPRARLHALGNAIVPQIPEMIARQISAEINGGFQLAAQSLILPASYLPTPTVAERDNAGGSKPGPVRPCLSTMARDRRWPTPCAHIAKEYGSPAEYERTTPLLTAQAIGDPSKRGVLNPDWVELLMGYEPGHTRA